VWEADHDKLEINLIPLRGKRLVRPWLTVIEDGFSRLVVGWALSLYPTAAEVLVAIREGIAIDEERGPWGGVPQLIRFDDGKEFLAHAVKRAAGELGARRCRRRRTRRIRRARSSGCIGRSARG
jgi:putative transposase